MPHCKTLIDELRQQGFRLTPQREMIIEALAHSDDHLTAEAIYSQIQARTQAVNLATVYRTLDLLVEQGLVTRADLGAGQIVYATSVHGPHLHLVCRKCGQVSAAPPDLLEQLAQRLENEYAFQPNFEHLSIFGLCANCQSKGDI